MTKNALTTSAIPHTTMIPSDPIVPPKAIKSTTRQTMNITTFFPSFCFDSVNNPAFQIFPLFPSYLPFSFLLKIKSVQPQSGLHTEKRIAPIVATQSFDDSKGCQIKGCIFTKCKNASFGSSKYLIVWQLHLTIAISKFQHLPEK